MNTLLFIEIFFWWAPPNFNCVDCNQRKIAHPPPPPLSRQIAISSYTVSCRMDK
jgi:hypothetical protein